jgi:hypothetical protein
VHRAHGGESLSARERAWVDQSASLWLRAWARRNAVAPWYIETPLTAGVLAQPEYLREVLGRTPMGRVGQPEEVRDMRERASPPRAREKKRRWVGRVDPWNGRCSVQQQPTGGGLADLLLSALHHSITLTERSWTVCRGSGEGWREGTRAAAARWPEVQSTLHIL